MSTKDSLRFLDAMTVLDLKMIVGEWANYFVNAVAVGVS
jgi:hypothetical protein